MNGFEHFTVLDPTSSKEVRAKLQEALDTHAALPMTLSPQREDGVTPLRDEPINEEFHLSDASFKAGEIIYLGHNPFGDTITIIVKRSEDELSTPATATIVRRSRAITP